MRPSTGTGDPATGLKELRFVISPLNTSLRLSHKSIGPSFSFLSLLRFHEFVVVSTGVSSFPASGSFRVGLAYGFTHCELKFFYHVPSVQPLPRGRSKGTYESHPVPLVSYVEWLPCCLMETYTNAWMITIICCQAHV